MVQITQPPQASCFIIQFRFVTGFRVKDSADQSPTVAPTHASRPHAARLLATLTSAFGWLMCTLATGAVAAFAALVLGTRPCWLILVLALPLTLVLKTCGCLHVRWPAVVAVFAVLVAGFYATCLVAVARIAAVTGFPFGQAFRTGGAGLTLQVAMLGLDALDVLVFAAAAAIAASFGAWLARTRRRN